MLQRSWTLAVLLVLLACETCVAAPVTVQLRVEGATSTIFEGPVTTDGHVIDKGDGPHPCDGTNAGAHPAPGPTMTAALDDAARVAGFSWAGKWFSSLDDFSIDAVGPDAADPAGNQFWGYTLNYSFSAGGCQEQVRAGDDVLYGYDIFNKAHLLKLDGPARALVGQAVSITAIDGATGAALPDASIAGAPGATTGPDGRATVSFDSAGLKTLKAERADSLRSNAVKVCVSASGADDCGVPPSQLGPGRGPAVKDSRAPVARISGPRDGRTYRRGPRLLRGIASDAETGVAQVKLAFRRHAHGSCRWWSGRRERFVGSNCHKKFFFAIGEDARWSYLLPRALPAGRYVLDVKAFDRARNRDERFERGRNRVIFYVSPRRTTASSSARRGASVGLMVVGRSRTLAGATTVRARSVLVRAGARSCKVAASTPLAALVASLRRARVGYRLRDYGDCSKRTATGSGQLYVSRIGSERGRGNDGWFYKVNDRAPEIGAADPAAASLMRGDRVLWFYCLFDRNERSCQRTLRLLPDGSPEAGKPFRLRVRGYDNVGRSLPVAGATVTYGRQKAVSGADGIANVLLEAGARAGRPSLVATRKGMVPSFPFRIDVR
jgi:hypothetical protein